MSNGPEILGSFPNAQRYVEMENQKKILAYDQAKIKDQVETELFDYFTTTGKKTLKLPGGKLTLSEVSPRISPTKENGLKDLQDQIDAEIAQNKHTYATELESLLVCKAQIEAKIKAYENSERVLLLQAEYNAKLELLKDCKIPQISCSVK